MPKPDPTTCDVNRRQCKAILFDLDGVIATSEIQKCEAHVETVLKLGGTLSQKLVELYVEVIGLSYEETRDRFLECGSIVATSEIKEAYQDIYQSLYRSKLEDVKLAPGAQQLLQIVSSRQYRIGLVSSAHSEEVTTLLRRHQISISFKRLLQLTPLRTTSPRRIPIVRPLNYLV